MDTLAIEDLSIMTRIGVPDAERSQEQRVLINVQFHLDTRASAKSDDVSLSVNYADAAHTVHELAKTERKTIERFAEDIAEALLSQFSVTSVTVNIRKFALPNAASASVTITRP